MATPTQERRRALVIMESCDIDRPKAPQILDLSNEEKLTEMCPACADKFREWLANN